MDSAPLFRALAALADENASFFGDTGTESGRRLAAAFAALREQGRRLEPALRHFARLCHRFDLDDVTPGNGYRSLVQTARCCLAHAVHRSRYVAAHRRSLFFRAGHNAAELEAYGAALAQLRALLCLAQRLLARSRPGCLFPSEEDEEEEGCGVSELVLREYSTMQNGCFYGRCLGFQFAPSIRPVLQTIAIGLVSFGENYKRHQLGLGVAAGSLFTSGKFALDPELRGAEFERLTQNLDVHFWKSFWNLTESQLLASVATMAATPVGVCKVLSVPPEPLELPLAADPSVTVTISPPVAHSGPGPVHMRLLCYHLREGQDSPALNALSRSEGVTLGGSLGRWRGTPPLPPSPGLLVHFHGGGFVAQTSRSHEPYLRGWARDLGVPILSVDYALAPESPFPRALEECFYAYCWALRHCHLLGSTAQRVCLAGDSAGGNLCLAVCLRAAAAGLRLPQGVVAAYPVTLVRAAASPSRLLTLLDPLLPLGVLCQCLSAYAGTEEDPDPHPVQPLGPGGLLRRDTGRLLGGLRRGAAAWLGGLLRGTPKDDSKDKELPEPPPVTPTGVAQPRNSVSEPEGSRQEAEEEEEEEEAGEGASERIPRWALRYPDEFQPLRTQGPPARFALSAPPLSRNPFMSPLLAPDPMLGSLPPVHLVACALDPMLDDSVALARRLRALGRPVTLRVVPDLPHGFLSLGILSPETRAATAICTRLLRQVLLPHGDTPRRGSQLLGIRRDSLAPQDPQRRGSQLLGTRRDSLAPHDPQRRGSQLGVPQDPSRRGSRLLGTRRDSLAPQDPQRRGSQLSAPQSLPRRGSQLLAPQDPTRRGSVLWGSPRQNLVPHGLGGSTSLNPTAAAPHGTGGVCGTGAASPGCGESGTQGSSTATPPGTDLTPGTGAALPRGTGVTSTLCDGIILTHTTVATSTPGTATGNSDGTTVTHGTSTALPRGTGAALPHDAGTSLTPGATSNPGAATPDGDGTTVTHHAGGALPPGTAAAHGDAPTSSHGAGSLTPPPRSSPLCCVVQAEAEGPSPPDAPSPPRAPPGRRLSGAQAVARRPSGPAGREVGS